MCHCWDVCAAVTFYWQPVVSIQCFAGCKFALWRGDFDGDPALCDGEVVLGEFFGGLRPDNATRSLYEVSERPLVSDL